MEERESLVAAWPRCAVSQVSKRFQTCEPLANRTRHARLHPADLEIGDTAGLETFGNLRYAGFVCSHHLGGEICGLARCKTLLHLQQSFAELRKRAGEGFFSHCQRLANNLILGAILDQMFMAEKTPVKKISEKSTKQEMLEAYQTLAKKLEEKCTSGFTCSAQFPSCAQQVLAEQEAMVRRQASAHRLAHLGVRVLADRAQTEAGHLVVHVLLAGVLPGGDVPVRVPYLDRAEGVGEEDWRLFVVVG